MKKDILNKILIEEDVCKSINDNLEVLLSIVPEIRQMIGFEHKHPHHHLDVWNHTLLALSISPKSLKIRLVLLFHDIGKPHSYQEGEVRHYKNHPLVSSEMTREILKRLDYKNTEIEEICYLIKEHDTLINNNDIENNRDITFERFQVQFCDALSHNPQKLEKRIKYLLMINEKLNIDKIKEKYDEILNELLNDKITVKTIKGLM